MRTLALLGALLLLAVQAQAEPLQGTADQLPAQDQPGAKDQDMAVSLAGDALFVRGASGLRRPITCYCRSSRCYSYEVLSGSCASILRRYKLCCS